MEKELKVVPIKNGTVIDHIAEGQALNVLKILEINARTNAVVSLVMNVKSKKMSRKDLVMIEDRELNSAETDRITLISPKATINIIRGSEVIKKHRVELPDTIEGIIRCPNPTCISNDKREPVKSKFITVRKEPQPPMFRCFYCERMIEDVSGHLL